MKVDPAAASVQYWLKSFTTDQIHEEGWIAVNKRFHGIARAARTYINENYSDDADKKAAFDGFTLALMAVARFEDIENLSELFAVKVAENRKGKQSDIIVPQK